MSDLIQDFKDLVYARVQALPDGTAISIGGEGTLNKTEILRHIELGDEIGQKMIAIDKAYFQALKDGEIYDYAE